MRVSDNSACENDGERHFIAAILGQAVNDALSNEIKEKQSAMRFINHRNQGFVYYCHLIDLEPRYAEFRMKKKIIQGLTTQTANSIIKIYSRTTYNTANQLIKYWIKLMKTAHLADTFILNF